VIGPRSCGLPGPGVESHAMYIGLGTIVVILIIVVIIYLIRRA
jgi:hypothetical protein